MRGSDLGPSGPPPGEGRTNRGDSRLKRIVLLVGVLGAFVMLAVGAISAGALVGIGSEAVAAPTPKPMDFACALKSNGLMRYVTSTTQCKKTEDKVTIKPGPVLTCVQPDGSVRKVSNFANCKPPAVQLTLPPASGTVYFCAANSTGVLRYVTDPSQCTSTESPVFVTPVNHAPVANNESYTVGEGGTLTVPTPGVLGNDTDAENDMLNAVLVSGPAHASSFVLSADGSFTYVHDGSETTSDSFTYKANDGKADSNIATVNITINPVNDAPVANDDGPYNVREGGTLNVAAPGVLGNDTDPDGPTFNAVLVSGPANAASLTLNSDGSFIYVHDGSETTSDSFTYRVTDGLDFSNIATVTIIINPVDDAPPSP